MYKGECQYCPIPIALSQLVEGSHIDIYVTHVNVKTIVNLCEQEKKLTCPTLNSNRLNQDSVRNAPGPSSAVKLVIHLVTKLL